MINWKGVIMDFLGTRPFVPFTIFPSEGMEWTIEHPECLRIMDEYDGFDVMNHDGDQELFRWHEITYITNGVWSVGEMPTCGG